jgi:peroxiredoxin
VERTRFHHSSRISLSFIRMSQNQQIQIGQASPNAVVDIIEHVNGEFAVRAGQQFGEILNGHKKAVLFALPGAFTPTCSEKHLPGFIERAYAFRDAGVEEIYCLSVNDLFVMKAWGKAYPAMGESGIKLVADGNGDFTRAIGMELDLTAHRLGLRCKRFAAVIENGAFTAIDIDDAGLEKSAAEAILAVLRKAAASN